ncbi:MAG: hypothetical protein EBX52_00965 [Proteobacteria bacterium]|nr:hypothetical protein [Pseudomonadota bacterium]
MKKSSRSLSGILPSIQKQIAAAGFRVSPVSKAKDSASFALQALKSKRNFFQMVNLTEDRPGFVVVEIFVSNLSTTEKWVDLEVGIEELGEFLAQVMALSSKELSRGSLAEEAIEAISGKIEAIEPKLALGVHELHHLEDELKEAAPGSKTATGILKKMAKVEDACIRSEMEISCLALRYFTQKVEAIDPFFFDALSRVNWSAGKGARA